MRRFHNQVIQVFLIFAVILTAQVTASDASNLTCDDAVCGVDFYNSTSYDNGSKNTNTNPGNTNTNTNTITTIIEDDEKQLHPSLEQCKKYDVGNCGGVIKVLYFYKTDCPHCEKVKPGIDELESKYNLNITKINVHEDPNLCIMCAECHNVSASVPMIVLSHYALVGDKEIEDKFEGIIKTCINNESCDCITVPDTGVAPPGQPSLNETYLFCWDDVPGSDSERLIEFLQEELKINWVKYAQIEKTDDNKKIIITDGENTITLELDMEEKKVILEITGVKTHQYLLKIEDSKLNVYKPPTSWDLLILMIIGAAIADALNICALGILIFLIASVLSKTKRDHKEALKVGLAFIAGIYVMYFLTGVGMFHILKEFIVGTGTTDLFKKIIGVFALLVGLLNLKDYLSYGSLGFTMEVPKSWNKTTTKILEGITSIKGAFFAGLVISFFLAPCAVTIYASVVGMMAAMGISFLLAVLILAVYNLAFVLPMIIVVFLVYFGVARTGGMEMWRQRNKRRMHLLTGIIMCLLGIVLITGLL